MLLFVRREREADVAAIGDRAFGDVHSQQPGDLFIYLNAGARGRDVTRNRAATQLDIRLINEIGRLRDSDVNRDRFTDAFSAATDLNEVALRLQVRRVNPALIGEEWMLPGHAHLRQFVDLDAIEITLPPHRLGYAAVPASVGEYEVALSDLFDRLGSVDRADHGPCRETGRQLTFGFSRVDQTRRVRNKSASLHQPHHIDHKLFAAGRVGLGFGHMADDSFDYVIPLFERVAFDVLE